MPYRLVLFDFDGTLADSFPFFISVFNQLADQHGFRRIADEEIEGLRAYGARELMGRVGLPAWKLPRVAQDFRARMRAQQAQIRPFAGMDAALAALQAPGLVLGVVSSNALDNVQAVLGPQLCAHIQYFECGMSIFGKATRIARVLRRAGVPAAEAILIGDQASDHEAAREAGVAFGAVGWGYGSLDALRALKPEHVFEQVEQLQQLATAG